MHFYSQRKRPMNCKLFESTDFYVPKIIRIIAAEKERMKKMTTLTINYDETNVEVLNLIKLLLAAGVTAVPSDEDWTEEEEKEAFLCTSKANASRMFAKYL